MIEGEPILTPDVAKSWITSHYSVNEVNGELIADDDEVPHTCVAGMIIASGNEPRYLSEVYREMPYHRGPLSDDVLLRMSQLVSSLFTDAEK